MPRFLLVVLYLRYLEAKRPRNRKDFLTSLSELANGINGLEETYIMMWQQILKQEDDEVEMARNVFTWVSYSVKRLTIREMQHALAAQVPGISSVDDESLYDKSVITEPCLGLIIVSGNGLIDFMHPTAREIFPEYLRDMLPNAQAEICRACLNYLRYSRSRSM